MQYLKLDDMRHGKNMLWVDNDGSLYYGPNRDNLICPEILEFECKLPPFTLTDIKAIFLMGRDGANQAWARLVKHLDMLDRIADEQTDITS